MIVWQSELQLHVQSVPITTNVVSSYLFRSWLGILDTALCGKICQ
jgi:hypothetical protein